MNPSRFGKLHEKNGAAVSTMEIRFVTVLSKAGLVSAGSLSFSHLFHIWRSRKCPSTRSSTASVFLTEFLLAVDPLADPVARITER
jgi:hypothetical protein